MSASGQLTKALTERECIDWSRRDEWTPTEAVFLLHGMRPSECELPHDKLRKQYQAAQLLLVLPSVYGNVWSNHPANWTRFAYEKMRSDLISTWVAIFVSEIPESLASIFDEEPDYCRFIGAIAYGHKLPMQDLIRFALCIGHKTGVKRGRNFEDVLAAMVTRLEIDASSLGESQNVLVDAGTFVELYPRNLFPLDSRCEYWRNWTKNHQEITHWLAGKGISKPGPHDSEKAVPSSAWVFRAIDSNMWEVGYSDDFKVIKGSKGFENFLLAVRSPNQEALEAIADLGGKNEIADFGSDDAIDPRARKELLEEIEDKKARIELANDEGDFDAVESHEAEQQQLEKYLKSGTKVGYAGKPLDAGNTVKKITKALRDRKATLVENVKNAGFEEISAHINTHFRIGDRSVMYLSGVPNVTWLLDK